MKKFLIPCFILMIYAGSLQAADHPGWYNVRDYGARADGKALDSKAINAAIAAAAKAGGGTVYLPAGNYLSGSIHLRSNICLYIDQGATLVAAPVSAANGYDPAEEPGAGNAYQDYGHSHWHNSLLWGEDLHDVSIMGPGRIWGKGLYRSEAKGDQSANKAIALLRCRNVIIRDISILHGGWFAILATGVDNFTLDNVKMDTNRDGVDVDACKNVRISNCYVNSPLDDGICLKSSFALGYARSTENVTISNCQVSGYEEGSLLDGTFKRTVDSAMEARGQYPIGRIKFGTESNGGFKNITISNCVFDHCRGLALESVDGALLEDVTITNISMRDIGSDPIFLRLGARMRGPVADTVGAIRRVIISNVVVYDAHSPSACTISGIPGHAIEDVELSHIRIYYSGGGRPELAGRQVPEEEKRYPEPGMFGASPAYGFFIRHVRNLKMTEVECVQLSPDGRPAVRMDDVQGAYIQHLTVPDNPDQRRLQLNEVSNISVLQTPGIPDQWNKDGQSLEQPLPVKAH